MKRAFTFSAILCFGRKLIKRKAKKGKELFGSHFGKLRFNFFVVFIKSLCITHSHYTSLIDTMHSGSRIQTIVEFGISEAGYSLHLPRD